MFAVFLVIPLDHIFLSKNVIFMSNVFLLHFCFWHFQIIFFIIVNLFTELDLQNKSEIIIFLSHWPWTQKIHDHRITLYLIINCLPKQCFLIQCTVIFLMYYLDARIIIEIHLIVMTQFFIYNLSLRFVFVRSFFL